MNQFFVLFAAFTRSSITGTSVSTPTVVASAAGEVVPNRATATATASSKKVGRTNHSRRGGYFVRQLKKLASAVCNGKD